MIKFSLKNLVMVFLVYLVLTLNVLFAPSVVFGQTTENKVVVLIVDHLSLEEFENPKLTNFREMVAKGAIGLMNTNTAGSRVPENTYSTLANGVRSLGGVYSGLAFNSRENYQLRPELEPIKVKTLYNTLTGVNSSSEVLHVGLSQLKHLNDGRSPRVKIGAIGTSLKSWQLRIGVFGNSDSTSPSRLAALFTMDNLGRTVIGKVDSGILQQSTDFPFEFTTDFSKLEREILAMYDKLDYIVIETGDYSRLETYRKFLTPLRYKTLREKTLQRIDDFLGQLIKNTNWDNTVFMIVSPTPADLALKNSNTVTPLILRGSNFQHGLLTSDSTRREGIIANTDVAPTILAAFDAEQPTEMIGRPIYSVPTDNATGGNQVLSYLRSQNQQLVQNFIQRPLILKPFVILQIIYVLVAIFMLIFVKSQKVLENYSKFAFGFLILPFLILGYRLYRFESLFLSVIAMVVLVIIFYKLLTWTQISYNYKIFIVGFLASAGILLDTLTGSNLVMHSPLGYDALAGARYYGIGNEFTGVLMGSTIVAFGFLLEEQKKNKRILRLLTIVYFLALTFILYSPSYGADAGGLITAVIALGYFTLGASGIKIRKRHLFSLGIATLILLVIGAMVDIFLLKSQGSHIGQAFGLLLEGNWSAIWDIIYRKVSVNIKLVYHSIWSQLLLVSIIAIGVMINLSHNLFEGLAKKAKILKTTFEAGFLASVVGFLVNDSGVVQAATTFIYLILPLLQLSLLAKAKHSVR